MNPNQLMLHQETLCLFVLKKNGETDQCFKLKVFAIKQIPITYHYDFFFIIFWSYTCNPHSYFFGTHTWAIVLFQIGSKVKRFYTEHHKKPLRDYLALVNSEDWNRKHNILPIIYQLQLAPQKYHPGSSFAGKNQINLIEVKSACKHIYIYIYMALL